MENLYKRKKLATIIGAVVVLIFITVYFFTGRAKGESMNVPVFESVPDEVVVYQGNMALVKDTMKIYTGKKVKIILPLHTIPGSIEIIDGGKKINKFKFMSNPGPRTSSYRRSENIRNLLSWKSPKKGARKVELRYLMQGMSWAPMYNMSILNNQSVRLQYRVQIQNNTMASSLAKVKLVSGEIGSPKSGSGIYYRQLTNSQFKLSAYERGYGLQSSKTNIPSVSPTKISAHYVYKLPKISLEKNGISYFTLLDKKLNAKKEYVWATTTGDKVDIVYTLTNSSLQPFAMGMVSVYKNNIFVGSDLIEWTPSGGKGHVTLGSAVDIQAEKTVDIEYDKTRNHRKEYHHKIKLTVKNFSNKNRIIKVIDQKYVDSVDLEFQTPPKDSANNTRMWILNIPPKDKKTIDYSFYSDSRYKNPYRKYN